MNPKTKKTIRFAALAFALAAFTATVIAAPPPGKGGGGGGGTTPPTIGLPSTTRFATTVRLRFATDASERADSPWPIVAACSTSAFVSDNGEPGTSDTFTITLSNGYAASGTLMGGNIQLHTR